MTLYNDASHFILGLTLTIIGFLKYTTCNISQKSALITLGKIILHNFW